MRFICYTGKVKEIFKIVNYRETDMQKNTFWKKWIIRLSALLGIAFVLLSIHAKIKKKDTVYTHLPKEKNPMEGKEVVFIEEESDPVNADGVRGHLEAVGESDFRESFYTLKVKRTIDLFLSFFALIFLSPLFLLLSLAIIIDDPGPVFFTQKRVGKNKQYFQLHKFRSMKMCTPHDTPTHMLKNPEQYITRVGKFIRAHSLDELPQIWDIFVGNMSFIGPRPGLWNQDCLIAERDKYHANDVMPGLSGLAQISGRDELEITEKAKIDGEYVEKIGFFMDMRCLFGTAFAVLGKKGVVEGGTGNKIQDKVNVTRKIMKQKRIPENKPNAKLKVLITGADSYIGTNFEQYVEDNYPEYFTIETIDMIDGSWKNHDFSKYDIIFHVAGLAHADIGHVTENIQKKYYKVNTELAIETARKAKKEGVLQFVFMSSAIVYGDSAPYGKRKRIHRDTEPAPSNFYGDSKWQADKAIRRLADRDFTVTVLRPPMIYGKGSKGNYPVLAKMAKRLPVFPAIKNERSMLYIDNLSEFLSQIMLRKEQGIFWPQNKEYSSTTEIVQWIAESSGHKIRVSRFWNGGVQIASIFPGKIQSLANKAFGNLSYEKEMSKYDFEYQLVSLKESIQRIENQ